MSHIHRSESLHEVDAGEQPTAEDDPNMHVRKKRRKYIAKACNGCKRRKIKCNGEKPCHRCGRQHLECVYAEGPWPDADGGNGNEGFNRLRAQMKTMQDQIIVLTNTVRTLTESLPDGCTTPVPVLQRPFRSLGLATTKETFQGPTSSAFSFDLAKSSLQSRGIVERTEIGDADYDVTQEPSPIPSPSSPRQTPASSSRRGDPLWAIRKMEALRLCRVYEEEMGIMYPILDLSRLLRQVEVLYGPSLEAPSVGSELRSELNRDDVHILRLVFACALTAEASGSSDLALGLFDSVRVVAENSVWGPPEIKRIIFLTLVKKALHRRETLRQPGIEAEGRDRVLRLFWSIRILDVRWSFGTGMPFALEDADIDPWLPEPEGEKTSYLRVMIRYSRIAAKVWRFISAFNNTNEIKKEEMNYLDWQVFQWSGDIPVDLRLDNSADEKESESESTQEPRSLRRLRALLYLRSNQLRMLIHRPVLHSAAHITRYPSEAQTVVDMAKETIRFIAELNETSDIYRLQQVAFNWFLVSALAVLFLAVAQMPSQFSASCREEFYRALELVKGFSTRSYISRRLWTSIRGLRKLAPQLGLHLQQEDVPDERTACLNGRTSTESVPCPQSQSPLDGAQMTRELMEWFEAVGNLEDQIMGIGMAWPSRMGGVDYGGELSSLMKECF
ncbi:hypothetical protein EYZ11_005792 [Aspergillus tanneri]|uniref:Zn(2)-C6 fungal-type domain-containing protein n=1 Tax=Aspergillus tanneri TaxID=1220188 RepID=A0A4S3JHB2_9EURO|nr:hypothetical protein EYZ11_005792 [Aspergillus tanneri]